MTRDPLRKALLGAVFNYDNKSLEEIADAIEKVAKDFREEAIAERQKMWRCLSLLGYYPSTVLTSSFISFGASLSECNHTTRLDEWVISLSMRKTRIALGRIQARFEELGWDFHGV